MMDFEQLLQSVMPRSTKTVAVAAAADETVLKTLVEAQRRGIAQAVLCGPGQQIKELAQAHNLDLAPFSFVEAPDGVSAAQAAVQLVREGKADMLMKGMLPTSDLLRAVLDKERGLRGAGILSHVCVLYSPILERMLLLTDAAMVTYPDLATKAKLIANAVTVAQGLGIAEPKVAVLAPVETVNPDMPSTLDAAALTMMNRRGQIKGCIVDGPLAMDLALSAAAAAHKGVVSEVAGQADILLCHNIDAGNNVLKTFTIAGRSWFGGLVMGALAPVVLSSRGDSEESKLYSIACAATVCG